MQIAAVDFAHHTPQQAIEEERRITVRVSRFRSEACRLQ
jgi:hypothetical protein